MPGSLYLVPTGEYAPHQCSSSSSTRSTSIQFIKGRSEKGLRTLSDLWGGVNGHGVNVRDQGGVCDNVEDEEE